MLCYALVVLIGGCWLVSLFNYVMVYVAFWGWFGVLVFVGYAIGLLVVGCMFGCLGCLRLVVLVCCDFV